jgi:hypothetical protein
MACRRRRVAAATPRSPRAVTQSCREGSEQASKERVRERGRKGVKPGRNQKPLYIFGGPDLKEKL